MTWILATIGSLLFGAVTFLLGRVYSQSEQILTEKRRIYEEFIRGCPNAQSAYPVEDPKKEQQIENFLADNSGLLSFYAAPSVMLSLSKYLEAFEKARVELAQSPVALHPAYRDAAQRYNDVILEMRRDAFCWSIFAHFAPPRFN